MCFQTEAVRKCPVTMNATEDDNNHCHAVVFPGPRQGGWAPAAPGTASASTDGVTVLSDCPVLFYTCFNVLICSVFFLNKFFKCYHFCLINNLGYMTVS